MWDPDCGQTEIVGENVVGQRAAEIGQDRRALAGGVRDRGGSAGMNSSGSTPTTNLIWQVAVALGGIALTGFSGLPVVKASTSKLHQPKTFSLGLRPGSPQSGSISGAPSPPSTVQSARATRTELGRFFGTHSRTLIAPVGLVIVDSECARITPGLESKPPQLPEWCPPSRRS